MLLAIDIGNTNIILGAYDDRDKLKATWRIATGVHRMADEYALEIGRASCRERVCT